MFDGIYTFIDFFCNLIFANNVDTITIEVSNDGKSERVLLEDDHDMSR